MEERAAEAVVPGYWKQIAIFSMGMLSGIIPMGTITWWTHVRDAVNRPELENRLQVRDSQRMTADALTLQRFELLRGDVNDIRVDIATIRTVLDMKKKEPKTP
jgi:hypothetical protein